MNEQEAIEQLQGEYLATNGTETPAKVRYHNEALDTAIAALGNCGAYQLDSGKRAASGRRREISGNISFGTQSLLGWIWELPDVSLRKENRI